MSAADLLYVGYSHARASDWLMQGLRNSLAGLGAGPRFFIWAQFSNVGSSFFVFEMTVIVPLPIFDHVVLKLTPTYLQL